MSLRSKPGIRLTSQPRRRNTDHGVHSAPQLRITDLFSKFQPSPGRLSHPYIPPTSVVRLALIFVYGSAAFEFRYFKHQPNFHRIIYYNIHSEGTQQHRLYLVSRVSPHERSPTRIPKIK